MNLFARVLRSFRGSPPPAVPPTAPPAWPASWQHLLHDPRGAVDPEWLRPIASRIFDAAGLGDLPGPSAEAHLAWAQSVGLLPSVRAWDEAVATGRSQHGHTLDVFLTTTSIVFSVGLDREGFEGELAEQMGQGETPDDWQLCACDGESFWFADASVAPRLRVLQIIFNYDHLHVRREIPSCGALVQAGLRHILETRPAPADLPECSIPAVEAPTLDEHAQALLTGLALIGNPCDALDAARVADIPARHLKWAVAQLLAAGLVEPVFPLHWQWGLGLKLTADALGHRSADEALISEMSARLDDLGPLRALSRKV